MRTVHKAVKATPISMSQPQFTLFRVIGSVDSDGKGTQHPIAQVDPFLFLDDAKVEGNLSASFKKHPHTGLLAVTYVLEGSMHAWDNIHGATPELNRAGGVYCVDAARGVVHGEAPIEGMRTMRLLQLWYNPGLDRPSTQAHYQLFQPSELPVYEDENLWVKVILGDALNLSSPVINPWPVQYLHIKLAPHKSHTFSLNHSDWQGFIYVLSGEGTFGVDKAIGRAQDCLVLGSEPIESIAIHNTQSSPLELVLATGKPHQKPFAKLLGHGGAFVADTLARARASMQRYEEDPEHFGLN
jgi:redox-sensitive bicupin YhaK (pirin superfamily)